MNVTEHYILNCIRLSVWSGFTDPVDVHQMVDDILEDGCDESMIRAAIEREFVSKASQELKWPAETDCDRLDRAFDELNTMGIIALQNAGNSLSDGITEVTESLYEREDEAIDGFCFYHGLDVELAIDGDGLMLAFSDLADDDEDKKLVGHRIKITLEKFGFHVDWDGNIGERICMPRFEWKRRRSSS